MAVFDCQAGRGNRCENNMARLSHAYAIRAFRDVHTEPKAFSS